MNLERREKELLGICLGLSILVLGVMFQYAVIMANNYQMPVPNGDYNIKITERHFFFNSSSEVSLYYLTDIIPLGRNMISIGDVFIFVGIIMVFGFVGRYLLKLKQGDDLEEKE